MPKYTVYLNEHIAPAAYAKLEQYFNIVNNYDHPEIIDGVFVRNERVTREMMLAMPRLQCISVHGVGVDTIDVQAAKELGIKVTNVPGANAQSVAELAVSLTLALARKITEIDQGVRQGRYAKAGATELVGTEIWGRVIGIMGTGTIAELFANIMRNAFECTILAYNPHKSPAEIKAMGYEPVNNLDEMFKIADIVSLHLPRTVETENLVNAEILQQANPDLLLVNTSRGGIVNEDALYEALSKGWIKAAASDVFVQEPPRTDHHLLTLPNFIATLHIGANTNEALDRVGLAAVENLLRNID